MKARKLFALIMACIMMIAAAAVLAGCSDSDDVLYVGVKNDVIGFGFLNPSTNEYEGMEIDLAYLIAEELGYSDVELTAVTAATRGELLDSGDLDCVIATFTIRPERRELWDFSSPYYIDAVTVLVENASGITTLEDLVGKTIGVSTSSTSAFALATAMADKGLFPDYELPESAADFVIDAFNEQGTTFIQYPDYPAISNALAAEQVNAFCVDRSILAAYKTETRSYINETFAPQEYGVATKKDGEMSGPIEELIVKWLADGTIDNLVNKHGIN